MNKPYRLLLIFAVVVAIVVIWNQQRSKQVGGAGVGQSSAVVNDVAYGLAAKREMAPSLALAPSPDGGYGSVAVNVKPEDRFIIKTGNLSLVVKDVPVAIQKIQDYAVTQKGFVVSSDVQKGNPYGPDCAPYQIQPAEKFSLRPDIYPPPIPPPNCQEGFTGFITFRIPADKFDPAIAAVKQLGDVKSQQVNGQDVTEEFVDVEAQLRNLQATEAQFLAIMRQATKIPDILAVQRELTTVRAQIEQLQGRKKYLEQSAAMSTITVNLSTNPENLPVVSEQSQWKPAVVAKYAVRQLLEIGKTIANAAIWVIVFIPVWLAIILVVWLLRKRMNKGI